MSKGHILVVEDHPDNQQLVTWILEDEEFDVTCAGTAEEGLSLLEGAQFDAVLMDISLPGMDGKAATRCIREKSEYKELPVFALTAHAIESELASIRASGVTDILHKPLDEEALITSLAGVGVGNA